ncbi:MAG: hypothetical protein WCH61_06020, partial [bacterium]
LKHDLQFTSQREIAISPRTGAAVRGICFPVLRRSSTPTTAPVNALTGEIQWTELVFYHLYGSNPTQLRRTVLPLNGDPVASRSSRQTQLDGMVASGMLNGATTKILLPQVSDYHLSVSATEFDGYAPAVTLAKIRLGVAVMTPGAHTFTFRISSKNPAASSYTLGLDAVTVGASGATYEGEYAVPGASVTGAAAPTAQAVPNQPGWSNVSQLLFTADSIGDSVSFPFYFDTWLESTFCASTAQFNGARAAYSTGAGETVLQLSGNQTCWDPATLTGDATPGNSDDLASKTIRVAVPGSSLFSQGQRGRVTFTAANNDTLIITSAYLMKATSGFNGDATTVKTLTFNGASGQSGVWVFNGGTAILISHGVSVQSDYADLPMEVANNYLVSYHVYSGRTAVWDPADSARPPTTPPVNSQLLNESSGDSAGVANWSLAPSPTNSALIPAVGAIYASYAASGDFISQVWDTRQTAPTYRELSWRTYPASSSQITVGVRAANTTDALKSTAWTTYSGSDTTKTVTGLTGQYVQLHAVITATAPYTTAPVLRDIRLTWDGDSTQAVDIAAAIAKGPDRGKFQFLIDGQAPPVAGLHADFTLYQDYLSTRYTKTLSIDVEPRNP